MVKSLLSIILLALCVPVYANTAVLIYTLNQEAAPWLMYTDDVGMTAGGIKSSFKMQAVLIFAVNTDTLETVVSDANQAPVLVLIGKDVDGSRLNYTLTGDVNSVSFIKKTNSGPNRLFATARWQFEDPNWSLSTAGSVGVYSGAFSIVTTKDGAVRVVVPQVLRGFGTIQKGTAYPLLKEGIGDGAITAVLNPSLTRQVNEGGLSTVRAGIELIDRKTPPNPNPLVWVMQPRQVLNPGIGYSHTMQCGDVNDPNPPVLYRFVCLDNSSISSDWRTDTTYEVFVGTTHFYRWCAIAKDGLGNTTSKGNAVWVQQ